jgi:nucleoside phosphorylase
MLSFSPLSAAAAPSETEPVTFGIVTALPKEYAAMRAMLDAPHDDVTPRNRVYVRGTVPAKGGGSHQIALALADQGTASAAHRATLLSEDFPEIQAIVMVGIAGAVPHPTKPEHHVRLGDIVASGEGGVVAYDFVKEHSAFKEPRHPPRPPDAALLHACRRLSAVALEGKFAWLAHVGRGADLPHAARPDADTDRLADTNDPTRWIEHPADPDRRHGEPRVFVGTIACANTLLKDPKHRDQVRDDFGARAIEMEGFGIAETAWNQRIGYFIIRAGCDYCDSHKGDPWQGYAAVVAAAYARALLEETPGSPAVRAAAITRQVRITTLSEENLRNAAEALLTAGTPPAVAALFPDASAEAQRALRELGLVRRELIAAGAEKARAGGIAELAALTEGTRHLIVAPPGSGKTHALWHGARALAATGPAIPLYIHAGAAGTWNELEQHLARVCQIDVGTLLRDPRVCVLLDGWSEFGSDNRAQEHSNAQRALLDARVIANGRRGASLDPRFRVWDLQPLAANDVVNALRVGLPGRPPPGSQLAELLRLPLALSLYLLLGGNAVTRGELLAHFHSHLSRGFPESFRQILAGAVAAVSLAGRERSRARLQEALRERAANIGLADPQKLLARLGTLDMRSNTVAPVHDLYWSWLGGVGLLSEDRVEASMTSLSTREGIALALEAGASTRESTVRSTRETDAILAASLSCHVGTPEEGAAAIRSTIVAMMNDARSSVRCRGALAAIKSKNEEFLKKALEVVAGARTEKIYLEAFGDTLDLDVLYAQRGTIASWLGAPGTDQLLDAMALRGDARWGTWLQQMADCGKLPAHTAAAVALACDDRIPGWTLEHLPALASKEAYRLRPVATRQTNVECARWIAEHYEECVQPNTSTFINLNSVLTACGDDQVFERLLARFPEMPESPREQLGYAIVERGEPWLARFQRVAFGGQVAGAHHKLAEEVSKQIDADTARGWIANGRVVEGWRALIERGGNEIVPELVAALPESFDGRHVIPVLEAMRFLQNPPDDLADALWSRARGTLQPRAAEFLIYALAPIVNRGVPSLVAQFARNPFFMTPYHFVRFIGAVDKWQTNTGLSFRVKEDGRDIEFLEWVLWRRAATDRTDALFKSRLISVKDVVPRRLLARFDDDPALCAELIAQCRKAGTYHKGLVDYLLATPALASSIPTLFSETLDTFPEETLLRVLEVPGISMHSLLTAIAAAPSPSHPQVHQAMTRRALAGEFDLGLYRAAAKALRVHPRGALLRLLKEVCTPGSEKDLWLIRETETACGELLVNERGEWLS